jgi:hypothetical protein
VEIQLKELGKRTSGNQIFKQIFMLCGPFWCRAMGYGWWQKFYGHAFNFQILALLMK